MGKNDLPASLYGHGDFSASVWLFTATLGRHERQNLYWGAAGSGVSNHESHIYSFGRTKRLAAIDECDHSNDSIFAGRIELTVCSGTTLVIEPFFQKNKPRLKYPIVQI